jgi:hypothetical protein
MHPHTKLAVVDELDLMLTTPLPCCTAFAISSLVSKLASSMTLWATPQPSRRRVRNDRAAGAESSRFGICACATRASPPAPDSLTLPA